MSASPYRQTMQNAVVLGNEGLDVLSRTADVRGALILDPPTVLSSVRQMSSATSYWLSSG